MARLDKESTVSLEEPVVSSSRNGTRPGKAPHREGGDHSRRVHGEAEGGYFDLEEVSR